jgi:hypothetical protein
MITFKKFLEAEETSAMGNDALKDMLERDCSFFLQESKRQGFLIRGMKGVDRARHLALPNPEAPEERKVTFHELDVRQDRKPSDMSESDHKLINNWFKNNFDIAARSSAVFCTGSSLAGVRAARNYGDPYIIFPTGTFKYVWSPRVPDLYAEAAGRDWTHGPLNSTIDAEEGIDLFMTKMDYQNHGLEKAVQGRMEVMVACTKYYAFEYEEHRGLLEKLLGIK